MKEKRRYPRYEINGMAIYGKVLRPADVQIHNIGLGGAHITIKKKLDVGSEYVLHLMHKGTELVPIKGVVLWEKLEGNSTNDMGETIPVYSVGIEFKGVITSKGSDMLSFIGKASNDFTLRLKGLRVKFHVPEKVILQYPEQYTVKKISKGGMLLETKEEFPVEAKFPIEIMFPIESEQVMFLCRVASCMLIENKAPKHFDVGIEFIDVQDKDRITLEKFISSIQQT